MDGKTKILDEMPAKGYIDEEECRRRKLDAVSDWIKSNYALSMRLWDGEITCRQFGNSVCKEEGSG